MSNIIQPNTIFGLRCLGDFIVPEHQFLSGEAKQVSFPGFGGSGTTIRATELSVDLVLDGTAIGALWLALDAGSSLIRFTCFEDTFLQGDPTTNQVSIVGKNQADGPTSVTSWEVIDLPDGHVQLKCAGQKFLNGKTREGALTLETDSNLSGTHWEVVSVSPPAEGFPPPPHGDQ